MTNHGLFEFSYTPEQWTKIAAHLYRDDNADAVRNQLEKIGRRFLITTFTDHGPRQHPLAIKRRAAVRASISEFLKATDGLTGEELGLGIVLDDNGNRIAEITKGVSKSEFSDLRSKLKLIDATMAFYDGYLLESRSEGGSNAERPRKNYVISAILCVWSDDLGRPLKKDGVSLPAAARFLSDAAVPILRRDSDGLGSPDAIRKAIEKFMENRAIK